MSDWRDDCEVMDWRTFVSEVRPTPEHDWAEAWKACLQDTLPVDDELLDWCAERVERNGGQHDPIIVRDGVVVSGLEQALAWYYYGPRLPGWARIYVKREGHAGEPTPG